MGPLLARAATALATTAGAAALTFGVGAPPERCPEVTVAEVTAGAHAAAGWLIDNQQADGTWLYEYDRAAGAAIAGYNVVRHAGVMMSLYQAAAHGVDGALESADRGLAWARDHLVERDGWAGVTTTTTLQAGTNALLVAGLVERRHLTGDDRHDELIERLGRFLADQVEPSGAVLAYYDLGPDRARPETYSIYYTGEAYWALARLHREFPDAGWGELADRIGHYIASARDDAEDVWPPLADHWSGYGVAETAAFPDRPPGSPLTDAELDLVRRQGGLIGQRVRSISQRFGPWGVAVRGTFTPRGGGYGVFGEGLSGLWRAASLDGRLADERDVLGARAVCIVGLALDAQVSTDEAAAYDAPGAVEGAWFIDDVTRMDDQQHALSALLMTLPIIAAEPSDGGHPAPSVWLWLVVVVAAIGPLRAAAGVPARDRSTERIALAIGGGLIGATLLLAVGAASGWVLDALDVSLPAMRLAAAGLCLLSLGVDLARRPPTADRESDGRLAALVPVAVPLLARPAALVAGLSVVADHGLVAYAVSLAVAVGAFVAAAAAQDPAGEAPSIAAAVARWGSSLLTAAGIAASILLIADAVFDI